ncbi:CAP domain-containing protein [Krasilnikovia sp. M28-CT-15]|uniref:CAP domain-containing protein n=1 Tax=Krasilnikovia sp. M28-CT-15 TaxID=3373540 RepID=UPI003875E4D8
MGRKTVRKVVTTAGVLLAGAGASLAAMAATAAPAQAAAPAPAVAPATLQSRLVTYTNNTRVRAGCKPIRVDQRLLLASRGHSAYQARTNKMSHIGSGGSSFGTRAKRAGYAYPQSENVAYGHRTASATMKAWMASPGHRANIVNCKAKSMAVGVAYSANGTPYYTQMFGWT